MNPKRLLSVLLIAALALVPAGPALAQDENIVEIATSEDDFSTFVAALSAAELTDALSDDGPFTVFAPTNDAFAELPEGLVEELLEDPSGDLTQILLYHVLPGLVLAEDISDGLQAETLQGDFVVFSIDGESVVINQADIVTTDMPASNGVIHVINRVLLPPDVEVLNDEMIDEEEAVEEEAVEEEAVEEEAVEEEEAEEEAIEEEVAEEEAAEEEAAEEEAAEEEVAEEEEEVEVAENGDVSAVVTDDQVSDGTLITISSVTTTQAGWIVIHADAEGRPGPVVGQTAVPAGTTENVIVFLEEGISGETELWAMLHVDEGEVGVFEFPGPDVPVRVDDTIVMASFTASAPEVEVEEPVEEEVVEEEVMEEVDVEEVDEPEMVEPEVDEEEAPETLPATGGGMTGGLTAVGAAMMVLLALAGISVVNRRRLAS